VKPHPRTLNEPEQKVAGRNACRAVFEARRDDIRRVYVTDETLGPFGDLLKWCAQNKIAYHIKTNADLDAIAETVHHDGVVLIARLKKTHTFDEVASFYEREHEPDPCARAMVVLLEDVKNPHNLGAILRVCAHFGVRAVLAAGETPSLSPAAMRTAEGGAEHVDIVEVGDGKDAIERMKEAGFTVIATSSHTNTTLGDSTLPPRSLVLFGSEGEGLSRALADLSDVALAIPGSGALESLNVACAASVVLWELWRAPSRAAQREPPRAPQRAPQREPQRAPQREPERAPPRASDRAPGPRPQRAPPRPSNRPPRR
jgi:TrmH RNA methyltransferase